MAALLFPAWPPPLLQYIYLPRARDHGGAATGKVKHLTEMLVEVFQGAASSLACTTYLQLDYGIYLYSIGLCYCTPSSLL